ncbi:MAG TPA: PEP-CTERM sorting domain-containing protein [Roseateles sp.]|nr:PEP-CTERM sorting domain-containing protein [Roseateles sp.]
MMKESKTMKVQQLIRAAALGALALCGGLAQASPVTFTFSSSGVISIPDSGPATPYPSTINVGQSLTILDVNVGLLGLSHSFPDDLDILLVGPGGQKVLLMSDTGGGNDVSGLNLTFDDEAAGSLPDSAQLTAGSYKPTDIGTSEAFPAPAPAGPYGSSLSAFDGGLSNGSWSLFVRDDASADIGRLAGWSLTLTLDDGGNSVPEPTSLGLVGVALLGLAATRRRR